MQTSIVIPTWPRLDKLIGCLAAVHEHTEGDYEVLVIDNGSEWRGSTWGVNRGLRAAEGDYLVLLHDDALVSSGWLPPLHRELDAGHWLVSATDPHGSNWAINAWCYGFTRASYERLGGVVYDERWIHWLQDCELPERIEAMGGSCKRADDSLVRHAREEHPTDEKKLETMRAWHEHDYGYGPASW